jgi:hypothetical protein
VNASRETRLFDVASASQAVQASTLEDWIHTYLTTGDWANEGLAYGLKRQQRWWRGPLELPLAALSRCCGPEPEMEYVMDEALWAQRIETMAATLADPLALPPLIVEYRQGNLSVRDGNKRHAAMVRKDWQACWVLIWYNSLDDYWRDA